MTEDFVDPTRDRFRTFRSMASNDPIHMLNLVCLRPTAAYPKGHELHGQSLTGLEAYRSYGRESGPILKQVGGRIAYSADFQFTLIGPESEHWDIVFIAEYPSGDAFVSMVKNVDYQKAVVHRQAAVRTSRLLRLSPNAVGEEFG